MSTKELIDKITKALSFKFPNDRMMPGITISHLKNGNFYVSLLRHNPNKKVIHKYQDPDLDVALSTVGRFLLESEVRDLNPLDELSNVLNPGPAWPCPDPYAYSPAYDEYDAYDYYNTRDDSWGFQFGNEDAGEY